MRRFWVRILAVGLLLGWLAYAVPLGYILTNQGPTTARPSEAVLVLGARGYIDGEINPCLVGRVREGVRLVRQGLAPYLIVSGGYDPEDGHLEAEVMAQIAQGQGLKPEQIVLEPKATSTYENLLFTKQIMEARGWDSLIIVSQAFHLPRAALMAGELGLNFTLAPVPDDPCPTVFLARSYLREPLALDFYWLGGRGTPAP
ncbi:MAG TPA: YdcF family protein [Meiothermus sp.]|nr:YdcF family protein [Meiothermus sp.]